MTDRVADSFQADGTATAPPEDTKSYFVLRTAGQQLPVYQKKKNGGTRHLTEVRKITGRVEDLKAELQHSLALPDDRIRINPVNRHIVIKVGQRPGVAVLRLTACRAC